MLIRALIAAASILLTACSSGTGIDLPDGDAVTAVITREGRERSGGEVAAIWARRLDFDEVWIFDTPIDELYLRDADGLRRVAPAEFQPGDTVELWPWGPPVRTDPLSVDNLAAVLRR